MADEFANLSAAIVDAAAEFGDHADAASGPLLELVGDVQRATGEALEIFPVCHHSAASGIHLARRLQERAPKVLFVELCEDLIRPIGELGECDLPIALQAFGSSAAAFPDLDAPLSIIAPLTELGAEYQAIAFAATHPGTELVFVDRSVDHYFQWLQREEQGIPVHDDDDWFDDEDRAIHGGARAVEVGTLRPSFSEFTEFLLSNAHVGHFSEWWSAYVEEPALTASYDAYRRVMFLVGSLIRRLGTRDRDLEMDRQRERFMWTRMKTWLREHKVAAADALYICGAAHSASDVDEYGTDNDAVWNIPPATDTEWLYGLIPSSYSAIEAQFSHPRGTVSQALESFSKAKKSLRLQTFSLPRKSKKGGKASKAKSVRSKASAPAAPAADIDVLLSFLRTPPEPVDQDRAQLLRWCTGIVGLARKNGYLASTADSIAIYENAVLLANLRARAHPSPYDFTDAAVTCLEKAAVPGKRSVLKLCHMLLGADKVGQVGYHSLPPLVQDVYNRLAAVKVSPKKRTMTRVLLDMAGEPTLREVSNLLWRLHYLLPDSRVARPIMGELALGAESVQESWDVRIAGAEQSEVIQLAYEGITVEQVLEKRIREQVRGREASALSALRAVHAAELLLDNVGLCDELGHRSVTLLASSTGADDAHAIFDLVRELIHYYRTTPRGLPSWLEDFVATGYRHYATLLPEAFGDRGTEPQKVAGMLAFVFTLESLALSLGCNRTQLMISIESAAPLAVLPEKKGLLWACEWLLETRTVEEVRSQFDAVLANPMSVPAFPGYLAGFLLALEFSAQIAPVGVELLSRAFAELPDSVLMPWLPGLLDALRARAHEVMPSLLKEASASLPRELAALDSWVPPWTVTSPTADAAGPVVAAASESEAALAALLGDHRAAPSAIAASLGYDGDWGAIAASDVGAAVRTGAADRAEFESTAGLLATHGAAAAALADLT